MKSNCKNKKRKGFTLVELIVVLVILGILATLLLPTLTGYIDKARGMRSVAEARQAYMASTTGLLDWKAAGSPGNSDTAFKKNIELEILRYMELGDMSSHTGTADAQNTVQVALSLPSYYSQGWQAFITECKTKNYRNFVRVWVGKNSNGSIGDSVKGIYYVSADGKFASRIVFDGNTKLGSTTQKTGTYYEKIE